MMVMIVIRENLSKTLPSPNHPLSMEHIRFSDLEFCMNTLDRSDGTLKNKAFFDRARSLAAASRNVRELRSSLENLAELLS